MPALQSSPTSSSSSPPLSAPVTAMPQQLPLKLELALDSALESYLTALSSYQLAQSQLSTHLKSAHFSLAQAKLALGPSRLSQSSYDLSPQLANVLVDIRRHGGGNADLGSRVMGDDDDHDDRDGHLDATPQQPAATVSTLSLEQNKPVQAESETVSSVVGEDADGSKSKPSLSSSTLRHRGRVAPPTTTTTATKPTTDPRPGDQTDAASASSSPPAARPLIREPHLQFSSLPPPALRSASSEFQAGLKAVLRVVEARQRVELLERSVGQARQRLLCAQSETEAV